MANTAAPFGFRQWRRIDGGAPTAGFDTLFITSSDASVIYTGDPVVTSTLAIAGFGNYVTGATSGISQIRGIFFGCEYYSATVNRKVWSPYYPGSVATSSGTNDVQAWVCTDPEMLYLVQVSGTAGSTNTVLTSSYVNLNFGYSSGTLANGNTTTGISGVTLAATSFRSTTTLPFRLYDFYSNYAPPGVNGTDNTTNGQFVIVLPNNWDRNNFTGV
jgi:hypothetical protein